MDGTLAKFREVNTLELLYEPGYFLNLEPHENMVQAVKLFLKQHKDCEVYIMSAVLSDSQYALKEKNHWLDYYLPEIDREHRIFPPCGKDKKEYIPDGILPTDTLLDDYTKNLLLWNPPGHGIKLLNGINHTHKSWEKDTVRFDLEPQKIADRISMAMDGRGIKDQKPQNYERLLEAVELPDKKENPDEYRKTLSMVKKQWQDILSQEYVKKIQWEDAEGTCYCFDAMAKTLQYTDPGRTERKVHIENYRQLEQFLMPEQLARSAGSKNKFIRISYGGSEITTKQTRKSR